MCDTDKELLDYLSKLSGYLEKGDFKYARGSTKLIDVIVSRHRAFIQTLINVEIKRIFEQNYTFSFSFEEIQSKSDSVFQWFDEITSLGQGLRAQLDTDDKKAIMTSYKALFDKVYYDNPIADFSEALNALAMQFILYLENRPQDELFYLFDKLNFHPIVKKHSAKLFKDGHYARQFSNHLKP